MVKVEARIERERPCRTLFVRNIKVNHPLGPCPSARMNARFPLAFLVQHGKRRAQVDV
jgi:hypothetical protein